MAQMAKNRQRFRMWQIFKLDVESGPLKKRDFGEIGNNFGKICEIDENTPMMKLVMGKLGT